MLLGTYVAGLWSSPGRLMVAKGMGTEKGQAGGWPRILQGGGRTGGSSVFLCEEG